MLNRTIYFLICGDTLLSASNISKKPQARSKNTRGGYKMPHPSRCKKESSLLSAVKV
uniref:Uncharacterized protein n=1 Tax=Anguilla anguilla TaxID=7936 RepID=A0A0E9Q5B6_ANGAN